MQNSKSSAWKIYSEDTAANVQVALQLLIPKQTRGQPLLKI